MNRAASVGYRTIWEWMRLLPETILCLRSQVIELLSQIRLLEAELTALVASRQFRLSRYREVDSEATWIEMESLE
ncbi:MAG: hypothetical protein R6V73_03045 [Anaerolineales bacterium]